MRVVVAGAHATEHGVEAGAGGPGDGDRRQQQDAPAPGSGRWTRSCPGAAPGQLGRGSRHPHPPIAQRHPPPSAMMAPRARSRAPAGCGACAARRRLPLLAQHGIKVGYQLVWIAASLVVMRATGKLPARRLHG